jgi:3-methyladenine DNA glycosylase/8-oxoguanine DNA glycosylase
MHARAVSHLKKSDPALGKVIDLVGPCRFAVRADGTHFDHIVRAIVFQQLSGKAASTIYSRVHALYGDRPPTAAELLATDDATLRGAGLSWAKIKYVKDLSAHALDGRLPVDRLHELDDTAIMEALVQVKGIGRWSAQMFLMSRLGRPNVIPELDLGIRKAVQRAYGLRKLPTPAKVLEIGMRWEPYGTIAAWYLWRSLEHAKPSPRRSPSRPRRKASPKKARKASSPRRNRT